MGLQAQVRTTREYETIFIVRPDAVEDEITKVLDRVSSVMEKLGGHVLKREDWGKRKLAYRIEKYPHGLYYYFLYLGYNDLVHELERNLRMLEPVIRYMTVKLDEDLDRDARIQGESEPKPPADPPKHIDRDDDDDDDDDEDDDDDDDDD